MSIQNTDRKNIYSANGSTIYWPYTFSISTTDGSDLVLYVTDSNGTTKEIATTLYTRDVKNKRIKYPKSGNAVASGNTVTVARNTELTQKISLRGQSFDPKSMETALDKLTMIVQEQGETLERAVVTDITTTGANYTIAAPVKGKVIGWSEDDELNMVNYDNPAIAEEQAIASAAAAITSETNAKTSETNAAVSAEEAAASAASNNAAYIVHTAESGLPNPINSFITKLIASNWNLISSSMSALWSSVCWSLENKLFLVAGANSSAGCAYTSPDGITWTSRTTGVTTGLYAICWSSNLGLFVAVGGLGTIITSPDGITWTTRTSGISKSLQEVCWSSDKSLFVAVGTDGVIITSPDGITWTSRTSGMTYQLSGVCWASELGLFVIVSDMQKITSPDGITWTILSNTNQGYSICWSSSKKSFVSVGTSGRIETSPDGITWATRTSGTSASLRGVCCTEDGIFVIVGLRKILVSSNGSDWKSPFATDQLLYGVCWSDYLKKFVIIGGGSSTEGTIYASFSCM